MRTDPVNYVLTTYSATMFGHAASVHQKLIDRDVAITLVNAETQIVATRPSHENLAKSTFGGLRTTPFADMAPEKSAVLIHYRGAPIGDDGKIPEGGVVSYYLIESEEYQDFED